MFTQLIIYTQIPQNHSQARRLREKQFACKNSRGKSINVDISIHQWLRKVCEQRSYWHWMYSLFLRLNSPMIVVMKELLVMTWRTVSWLAWTDTWVLQKDFNYSRNSQINVLRIFTYNFGQLVSHNWNVKLYLNSRRHEQYVCNVKFNVEPVSEHWSVNEL